MKHTLEENLSKLIGKVKHSRGLPNACNENRNETKNLATNHKVLYVGVVELTSFVSLSLRWFKEQEQRVQILHF